MRNKKKIAALLTVAAMSGTMFTALPVGAKTVELISNGSFDENTSPWYSDGGDTVGHTTDTVGENAGGKLISKYRWNGYGSSRIALDKNVLKSGTTLRFKADVYYADSKNAENGTVTSPYTNDNGNEKIYCAIFVKEENEENGTYFTIEEKNGVGQSKWINIDTTYTPSEELIALLSDTNKTIAECSLVLRTENSLVWEDFADYYLDNVSLTYDDELNGIDKTGWTATAERNNDIAGKAFDGVYEGDDYRWTTGEDVDDCLNTTYILDLGEKYNISGFDLNQGTDIAPEFKIFVSDDGDNYKEIKTVESISGITAVRFDEPIGGRYIKLQLTKGNGDTSYALWSIYEIDVYGKKAEEDPVTDGVAQIGKTTYATLDEAVTTAENGDTITVLADCELSSVVDKAITLKGKTGNEVVTVKSNPDSAKTLFTGDTTIENITISGGDSAATAETAQFNALNTWNANITIKNSTIKNFAFGDTGYGKYTMDNVNITGCYKDGWMFAAAEGSTFTKVTATGNNFVWAWTGFVYLSGKTTFKDCKIKDNNNCRAIWTSNSENIEAVIDGGNDLAEVQLGPNNGTATINGNNTISNIGTDDKEKLRYTINLGATFSGSLNIILDENTAVENRAVANVGEGADISKITVSGMDTDKYVLKVNNGKLVITSKNTANLTTVTENIIQKDYSSDTGDSTNKATGFVTTITNSGDANGLFKKIGWTVTSGEETKTFDMLDLGTEITLATGADVKIGLIVSGLCDGAATATATLAAE